MKKYFDGSKRMIAEKNVRWKNTFLMYAVDKGKIRFEEENYVLLDENGNNLHTLKRQWNDELSEFDLEEGIQVDMVRVDYVDLYVDGGRDTFFDMLESGIRIKTEMHTYIKNKLEAKRRKRKFDRNVLVVLLQARWWDMIKAGVKKEEYRDLTKKFWQSRLYNKDGTFRNYEIIRFQRGYTNEYLDTKFEGTTIGYGNPKWGAIEGKRCFVIKIGEIIK